MMQLLRLSLSVTLLWVTTAGLGIAAQNSAAQTNVFKPDPSITCNRKTQICSDNKGPAFGWTKAYFGVDAALKLANRRDMVINPDTSVYRLTETNRCDLTVKVCYRDGKLDVKLTQEQFGHDAIRNLKKFQQTLAKGKGDIVKLRPGLECAHSKQICYDQNGPSVGVTRLAFGNTAALKLLNALLTQQTTNSTDKN